MNTAGFKCLDALVLSLAVFALSNTPAAFAQIDLSTTVVDIQGARTATDATAIVDTGSIVTIVFTVEHASGTAFMGGDEFNTTAGVPPAQANILRKQSMISDSENVPCSLAGCTGKIDTGETVTFTVTFLGESPGSADLTIHSIPNLRTDVNLNNNTRTLDIEVADAPAADLGIQITDVVGALEFNPDPPKQARMNVGDDVIIIVQVDNDGPDNADSIVITGGVDPSRFQITSAVVSSSTTCEVGTNGDFFSCDDLTLIAGDTVWVDIGGQAVMQSLATDFSVSTGHPTESDFSNNDDLITLAIDQPVQSYSLSGFVFLDLDADGVQDGEDEVGLPGRVMFADLDANRLFDPAIDIVDSTDFVGHFALEGLMIDTVSVGLVPMEDWEYTVPQDGFQVVDFRDSPNPNNINQGTRPRPGAILGAKWKDLDGDGLLEQDEPLLENWTVYLDQNDNGTLDSGERSTTTDENGRYIFGNLAPGTYIVREVQQNRFITTFPSAEKHSVAIAAGQFVGGVSFGNRPISSLHGEKYEDLNGNGQRDEGEPGIDGVEIVLTDIRTGRDVARTTSMQVDLGVGEVRHGVFRFEDVPSGSYYLTEDVPSAFQITEPAATQGPFGPWHVYSLFLPEATELTGYRFGNQSVADVRLEKEHLVIERDRFFVMTVFSIFESPNTVVLDTLSADVELLGVSTSKGECSYDPATRVLRCELGTVTSDDLIEIRLSVRHTSDPDGVLSNDAAVSGDKPDPAPDNNKSRARGRGSRVGLEKTASADSVNIGDKITYHVKVDLPNDRTVITDTLGLELEFVSVSSPREDLRCRYEEDSGTIVCQTSSSMVETIVIEAIARKAGVIPNVVTAIAEDSFFSHREIQKDTSVVVVRDMTSTFGEPGDVLPVRFDIQGNHPNPFATETRIRIDLPNQARVSVDVFDILGRHVLKVPEKALSAGKDRSIEIDASALTSGVYFYRVTAAAPAGTEVGTGRFVVVRSSG